MVTSVFLGQRFFFGFFPALFRSDFKTFLGGFAISLILGVITFGIAWLVIGIIWAFMYNKYYTNNLLEKGYVFADDGDKNYDAASTLNSPASSMFASFANSKFVESLEPLGEKLMGLGNYLSAPNENRWLRVSTGLFVAFCTWFFLLLTPVGNSLGLFVLLCGSAVWFSLRKISTKQVVIRLLIVNMVVVFASIISMINTQKKGMQEAYLNPDAPFNRHLIELEELNETAIHSPSYWVRLGIVKQVYLSQEEREAIAKKYDAILRRKRIGKEWSFITDSIVEQPAGTFLVTIHSFYLGDETVEIDCKERLYRTKNGFDEGLWMKPSSNVDKNIVDVSFYVCSSLNAKYKPTVSYAKVPGDCFNLGGKEVCRVPGGCFNLGGKEVCLDAFNIGKTEVTQKQWKDVMGSNPSNFSSCGDECPVENVSWDDIQVFLQKLNAQSGLKSRLPTEAEWQYACTSGGRSEDYCGGNDVDSVAWYDKNSEGKTHKVGTKQPNGLGIYDMSGNVWEWVSDWYGESYPTSSSNPAGASSGQDRVLRGGSWGSTSTSVRTSIRDRSKPATRDSYLGFRLVLPQDGPPEVVRP